MELHLDSKTASLKEHFSKICAAPSLVYIKNHQTDSWAAGLLEKEPFKKWLTALREHSPATFEHSCRVGRLAGDLSLEIFGTEKEALFMIAAGFLHDLGKTSVPRDILNKGTQLTEEERLVLKMHPRFGFSQVVQDFKDTPLPGLIVSHHEQRKEKRYPRSGKERRGNSRTGDRRSTETSTPHSAILSLVDSLDALLENRSYKPALPPKEVREILVNEFGADFPFIHTVLARLKEQ